MRSYLLEDIQTIAVNNSRHYAFDGNQYLVFHLSDGYYATSAKCTHLFKSLEKGVIVSDKSVRCPLHRAEFDIRTGQVDQWACFPPGVQLLNGLRPEKALSCYEIIEKDGQFYLQVE
jgi:3-phenylpropionate/trans-cinnamate dioxygenase ferredoxin subunit